MSWLTISLLTLGGALLFEGLGWAVAPDAMRDAYSQMMEQLDARTLSTIGIVSVTIGLLLIVLGIRAAS